MAFSGRIKLTIELFLKRVLHFDWWGKSSSVNGQTLTQEERPQQSFCAADTSRCRNGRNITLGYKQII